MFDLRVVEKPRDDEYVRNQGNFHSSCRPNSGGIKEN